MTAKETDLESITSISVLSEGGVLKLANVKENIIRYEEAWYTKVNKFPVEFIQNEIFRIFRC